MSPIVQAFTQRWRNHQCSPATLALVHWWIRHAPEPHREVLALFAALVQQRSEAGDVAIELSLWYGGPMPITGEEQLASGGALQISDALLVPDEQALLAVHAAHAGKGEPWLGDGTKKTLLVHRDGLLLTWRQHDAEQRIAAALCAEIPQLSSLSVAAAAPTIAALFAQDSPALPQAWQRVAVATVIHNRQAGRRISVITGGPGTGKTTTVARLLAVLLMHGDLSPLHIRIAAPTGKAADRLAGSLRAAVAPKNAGERDDLAGCPPAIRIAIPTTATTVHALLGANPASGTVRYHAGQPLAVKLLIVDEASMLDPILFAAVLAALPPSAHLVLVGDPHQLTSVESGSLLPDLCRVMQADAGYDMASIAAFASLAPLHALLPTTERAPRLRGLSCSLRYNFRAEAHRPLVDLAAAILHGDVNRAQQTVQVPGTTALLAVDLRRIAEHLMTHASAIQNCADVAAALKVLFSVQVLCAVRHGPSGAQTLANMVDRALCPSRNYDGWYKGRAVLVTVNDRVRGLMNGDVGMCWPINNELRVVFPRPAGNLIFSTADLPTYEPAWAMTIHKSQGSEYSTVHVVMPPAVDHPLVMRELLYTAVTRAKAHVTIWSDPAVFVAAIQRASTRRSGLVDLCAGLLARPDTQRA